MTSPLRSTRRSTRPRRRQSSQLLLAGILMLTIGTLLLAGLRFVPGSPLAAATKPGWIPSTMGSASASSPPAPKPSPPAPEKPLAIGPAKVKINTPGWYSWAVLDQRTGKFFGSANMSSTSTTASLVKAWIAADYLRRATERGDRISDARLQQISIMIRDSDNEAASAVWNLLGQEASTKRLVKICDLTDSKPHNNWSLTRLSPRDIARMGACIQDGRAAGPKWTKWLLKEMRLVRGVGDFGIRKAFPKPVAKTIAIKNGWVIRDDSFEWHVNCLAIGDRWTMGVSTRYPTKLDYTHGAQICEDIAAQLIPD